MSIGERTRQMVEADRFFDVVHGVLGFYFIKQDARDPKLIMFRGKHFFRYSREEDGRRFNYTFRIDEIQKNAIASLGLRTIKSIDATIYEEFERRNWPGALIIESAAS